MRTLKMTGFLWLITGYLVIGYSFMLLRFPPVGPGVPIGEMFLLLFLLTTNLPKTIGQMGEAIPLGPLLLYWTLAFVRVAFGAIDHGAWAFRDASHFLDSLYLIVGFALAGRSENWERLWRWLPWILLAAAIYSCTYVYGEEIRAASPTLIGGSGQAVPIFGDYASSTNLLLFSAIYLLVCRPAKSPTALLLAIFCIAFGVIVYQARTTYFQIIAIFLLFATYRREALPRMLIVVPAFLVAVGVIVALGVKIPGRLSDNISFSFFIQHFLASFGVASSRDLIGSAEGVDLRLGWWHDIFQQLFADPLTAMTGLGYGIPLTHFINAQGVLVREPHNSIVSILSRLGIFGIITFFGICATLVRAAYQSMRACRLHGWTLWENRLLVLFGYFLLIFVMAMTEDAFEKPYLTIPYYAFWGFVVRFAYEAKRVARQTEAPALGEAYAAAPTAVAMTPRAGALRDPQA